MAADSDVIVNFSQVVAAFGGKENALDMTTTPAGPGQDDLAFAAFMGQAMASLEEAQTLPGVMSSPDDNAGALLQAYLAEYCVNEERIVPGFNGMLEVQFDDRDFWGWIRSAGWPAIKERLNVANRYPKPPWARDRTELKAGARIALFGDWGTNLYGAPAIRVQVQNDPIGFDAIVHLGDVYYAGRSDEVKQRMLNVWPEVNGATNRACNSNHEMYSGGRPYFTDTLPTFGQSSSTFVLESPNWLVVGLDTAYTDGTVSDDQASWLGSVLAGKDDRGVVLLSHHPLFSHHKTASAALQAQFSKFLETRTIDAWYWGHEHLHAVYERDERWGVHGRCVGHGGYPYFRKDFASAPSEVLSDGLEWRTVPSSADRTTPAARFLDGPNPFVEDDPGRYGPHGFLTLELQADCIFESSYTAAGDVVSNNEVHRARHGN